MNRFQAVSGWAAPFVDEESGEVFDEPRNVTPPSQPLFLWHRQQIADAERRAERNGSKAVAYAWRAALGLLVMLLPLPFWIRAAGVSVFLIAGLAAILNAEFANIAKRETYFTIDD